jgi:hypothetical protein
VCLCSIYEKIGKGKHSTVYKGRKKKTIQYHAIKSVDKSQKPRVLQEVRSKPVSSGFNLSCCFLLQQFTIPTVLHSSCCSFSNQLRESFIQPCLLQNKFPAA